MRINRNWLAMLALSSLITSATTPMRAQDTDNEIARAIRELTGREAKPEELDPSRYGLGYEEVRRRVQNVYYSCSDPALSKAIVEVTGRPPRGLANQGECNPLLYGAAQTGSSEALKAKVQNVLVDKPYKMGACRNPEVTRAVTEVRREMGIRNAAPVGAGETGQCNMYLYNNGEWSNFAQLSQLVKQTLTNLQASGVSFETSRGGECAWWDMGCQASRFMYWVQQQLGQPGTTVKFSDGQTAIVRPGNQVEVRDRYNRIVAGGAGNIVAGGAGNYQAVVGGRIVAGGAGNIVAGGAGN